MRGSWYGSDARAKIIPNIVFQVSVSCSTCLCYSMISIQRLACLKTSVSYSSRRYSLKRNICNRKIILEAAMMHIRKFHARRCSLHSNHNHCCVMTVSATIMTLAVDPWSKMASFLSNACWSLRNWATANYTSSKAHLRKLVSISGRDGCIWKRREGPPYHVPNLLYLSYQHDG